MEEVIQWGFTKVRMASESLGERLGQRDGAKVRQEYVDAQSGNRSQHCVAKSGLELQSRSDKKIGRNFGADGQINAQEWNGLRKNTMIDYPGLGRDVSNVEEIIEVKGCKYQAVNAKHLDAVSPGIVGWQWRRHGSD